MDKSISVILMGNPNCGKTTIFNNLTGSYQHVGNYSGVTVEKKEGLREFEGYKITIIDLPGTYGLTSYSQEETIAKNFVIINKPDVIVDVVDASNLERNLYLAIQLKELEWPLVLSLNMADVADKAGLKLDVALLEELLGVKVIYTIGSKNRGMEDLLRTIINVKLQNNKLCKFKIDYGTKVEAIIAKLENILESIKYDYIYSKRWLAIKLLENDSEIIKYIKEIKIGETILDIVASFRKNIATEFGDEIENIISDTRYRFVNKLYNKIILEEPKNYLTISDKIDKVLTNKYFAIPIFLIIMWFAFNFVFAIGAYPRDWIKNGFDILTSWIGNEFPDSELKSLLINGVIGGIGNVIVFLPSILLLFLVISLLEDTGYMARAAFIMDRIMQKVGLHGKSFIPLLLGFGCSIPAIMGTRSLENQRDRLVIILITPFISCSARLPVYTLLTATFFSERYAGTIFFSIYFIGITLAVIMARLLRSFFLTGSTEPFIMEMPPYRMPTIKSIFIHMWRQTLLYIKKIITLILAVSIIIWFATNYSVDSVTSLNNKEIIQQPNIKFSERIEKSYAGVIGKAIEPVMKPLGFNWKIDIGLIAGLSAKESLVSTLGTIYHMGESDIEITGLQKALMEDPSLNSLVAFTLMVFVLIYAPCIATLVIIKHETNSWRWPIFSFLYTTGLAWIFGFIVYQGGLLLGFGN